MVSNSIFCLVEGGKISNAFEINVQDNTSVSRLKDLIKAKQSPNFDHVPSSDLELYKVNIPSGDDVDDYIPLLMDIEDKGKRKLRGTSQVSNVFKDVFKDGFSKDTIHIMVKDPGVQGPKKRKWQPTEPDGRIVRPKLYIEPYDSREASMVFCKAKFQSFPLNDKNAFEGIRRRPWLAYFDRTRYISVLENEKQGTDINLFLRPRRFGKSLFLNTLACFHDVKYKDNYEALFQGLDIDKEVKKGAIIPGQYLILKFDFSSFDRNEDPNLPQNNIKDYINGRIIGFYRSYAPYLGEKSIDQLKQEEIKEGNAVESLNRCIDLVGEVLSQVTESNDPLYGVKGVYLMADEYDAYSNEYLSPNSDILWEQLTNHPSLVLKDFWSTVKSNKGEGRIVRCYITGVSPLSMADHTSGFNNVTNISWDKSFAGLCGLTEDDVVAALSLVKEEDTNHINIMKTNYNGYSFVEGGMGDKIFNTNTCLEYLMNLVKGEGMEDPTGISNSEVAEATLQLLANSDVAHQVILDCLANHKSKDWSIKYENIVREFKLLDLRKDIEESKSAWLSFMIHIGGLTFSEDKHLRIPNDVAAIRFAKAALDRYKLRQKDVKLAFYNIVHSGDIKQSLKLYRNIMCQRDVGIDDFEKNEEKHRDSYCVAILGNSHLSLRKTMVEFTVTRGTRGCGRIDMKIDILPKNIDIILEWKVLQIDYLDIESKRSFEDKAAILGKTFSVNEILDIKFGRNDKRRAGKTIKQWILTGDNPLKGSPRQQLNDSPHQQLKEYFNSKEINELKTSKEVKAYLVVVVGSRQIILWEMSKNGELKEDMAQLM